MRRKQQQHGFSLIETLIAMAIFAILSLALYLVIILAVSVVRDDQARLDALGIAQATIEEIRNVPYEEIGTVGGVPAGVFAQSKSVEQNNTQFTVNTSIYYVDDVYDDLAPIDTVSTDYKKIEVSVTWQNQFLDAPVELLTTISPEGLETTENTGTLWIEVYTDDAEPLTGATVHVTNNALIPTIDQTGTTDAYGRFVIHGTPTAEQTYHVEVSKPPTHTSSQTYTVDAENNPNPDPEDLSVIDRQITTKLFYIDELSNLNVGLQQYDDSSPITDTDITFVGEKRIGTDLDGDDIPKYTATETTDAAGTVTLNDIEYDSYTIDIADSAYDFAGSSAPLPYILAPGTSSTLTIFAAPNAAQTLLLTVTDAGGNAIENASVNVADGASIDITQTTNAYGQTFFTPLADGTFTIEVSATGFETYSGNIDIFADEQQTIGLTETP